MMGPRQVEQGALFYEFSLETHVPTDHLLRSIDRFVDLTGLRQGSCPLAWCSSLRAIAITGLGREDQAARVGRLTRGSSPIGAMLSRVM